MTSEEEEFLKPPTSTFTRDHERDLEGFNNVQAVQVVCVSLSFGMRLWLGLFLYFMFSRCADTIAPQRGRHAPNAISPSALGCSRSCKAWVYVWEDGFFRPQKQTNFFPASVVIITDHATVDRRNKKKAIWGDKEWIICLKTSSLSGCYTVNLSRRRGGSRSLELFASYPFHSSFPSPAIVVNLGVFPELIPHLFACRHNLLLSFPFCPFVRARNGIIINLRRLWVWCTLRRKNEKKEKSEKKESNNNEPSFSHRRRLRITA